MIKKFAILLILIASLGLIFLLFPSKVKADSWCPGWGPGSPCPGPRPSCGACTCEGWATDHDCPGGVCGHTYCKKDRAGCGGVKVCDPYGNCCWEKQWSCGCWGGPSDGDGDGVVQGERAVGRVWKDGTARSGYSITSADGKTAGWDWGDGLPYYQIGRWSGGTQVTITVNNPDPGYTCGTWSFDNKPNEAGGEASGAGCSARVTIGSGSYSPDWQNHLHFNLVCPKPASPTGLKAFSGCAEAKEGNVTVSLDWNDVTGATQYALRVNDYANGWTGTCASVNPGDICIDNLTSSSYSFTGKGGHTYGWWVHAINSCGWSDASGGPQIYAEYKPAAPSNITCTSTCNEGLQFTWQDNSNDEEGFRIVKDYFNNVIGTVSPNTTGWYYNWCGDHNNHSYNVYSYRGVCENRSAPGVRCACPACGTITGKVYQNLEGQCSGAGAPPSGWKVECGNQTYGYYEAETQPDGQTYKCKNKENTGYELPYDTYIVRFKTVPAGWVSIPACSQDSVILGDTPDPPQALYLWQGYKAWFQTEGGDIHAQGTITNPIPRTATEPYCSLRGDGGYPGVVSFGNDYDFSAESGKGEDRVSPEGWLANSTSNLPYSFAYFYNQLGSPAENWDGKISSFPGFPVAGETEILYTGTNVAHIPSRTFSGGGKLVILADANVIVNQGDVIVTPGSFLAVISSGNINIDKSVGNVQGIYVADGHISTDTGDLEFRGEGMFVSKAKPKLNRDFDDDRNNTQAALTFVFRPDLWINTPQEFGKASFTWQEIAP